MSCGRDIPGFDSIRSTFPEGIDLVEAGSFDCIYSISVLEHIPVAAVTSVCEGINHFSRQEASWTIHAVDHILLGNGAAEHLQSFRALLMRSASTRPSYRKLLTVWSATLTRTSCPLRATTAGAGRPRTMNSRCDAVSRCNCACRLGVNSVPTSRSR